MSDREQAIKDVAKATKSSAAIIAQILEDGVSLRVRFAVSQRERVIALERALREAAGALEWMSQKRALTIFIEEVEHVASFFEKCDAALPIARAALGDH